jgi:hypothetical protein
VSDMRPPSAKLAKASAPAITAAKPARAALPDGFVRTPLEPQRSEPLPLPPPPTRPDATPYAATKLPDLHVPGANDRVRPQLVKRRLRNQLLLAVLLVPLLGAGAVVGYMQLAAAPIATTAAPPTPATFATLEEPTLVRSPVEAAPVAVDDAVDETPAPPVPAKPQPIHAVLVRTWPIAATVKVGGRSFGSTPTYVKIPANTPVQLEIARPGFKPVTYPLISKTAIDRVFVRLERAKGKR